MIKHLDLKAITSQHEQELKAAVARVIESGWFLQGQETKRFEADFARYIGTSSAGEVKPLECIGVGNGLDALYLIMRAYKEMGVLHDGDEILVSANTFIATFLAITRNGLKPVPVEPTWGDLMPDITQLEAAITPRAKAFIVVHLYGRIAYNQQLADMCRKHNLKLVEDCAQSHGCAWNGVRTGALGDAAAFSFYPGKNLGAMGDAGAVVTGNNELARVVRALANYGSEEKYASRYEGINSRMSEIDAAVLSVKLKYLDEDNRKRQALADYYYEHIMNPWVTLPKRIAHENNVYHQFPIFSPRRDLLKKWLDKKGVQTLIHYPIAPHQQECYAMGVSLPVTERISAQELSIPMNQIITQEEARSVVEAINSFATK